MSLALKAARAGSRRGMPGRYGDPGLGGFLKGLAKGAVGFLTGGPVGAAAAVLPGIVGGSSTPSGAMIPQVSAPPMRPAAPGVGSRQIALPFAGPAPAPPAPRGTGTMANGTKLACPAGFHPNKSDYFLRDGTFVPEGSRCVRNRRRDPLNPKALRRAIGRIDAGKTWQSKMAEITTAKYTAAGNKKT